MPGWLCPDSLGLHVRDLWMVVQASGGKRREKGRDAQNSLGDRPGVARDMGIQQCHDEEVPCSFRRIGAGPDSGCVVGAFLLFPGLRCVLPPLLRWHWENATKFRLRFRSRLNLLRRLLFACLPVLPRCNLREITRWNVADQRQIRWESGPRTPPGRQSRWRRSRVLKIFR
jgi:hypothetical protein